MRVLVVVHGFPPGAAGGTEVYAEAQARALRAAGDEVLVLTREADPKAPEYRERREQRHGLTVVRVNNTFRRSRTFEDAYRNDAIGAVADRLIDEFKPDVAHVHHLTGLSTTIVQLLAARRIPCVVTLHDYWFMCHRGQLLDREYRLCDGPGASGCGNCLGAAASVPRAGAAIVPLMRAVERRLPRPVARALRRTATGMAPPGDGGEVSTRASAARAAHMRGVLAGATLCLAPSRDLRDRFIRFGVAPERIATVDLGVDHTPFEGLVRTPDQRLRVAFVGTLMASKAPHLLLEAFQRLRAGAASVDLFGAYAPYHGDDRYRAVLDPLLALPGVRHHGAVPHGEVVKALASMDVLVLPSIWPENSPLVIREAFLAGVPVVASRIGGIPEAVADGRNGLLFRPGDVDDLHRALRWLIEEPDLLPTLRAGIPAVRNIHDDVAATRGIYERVTAQMRSARSAVRTTSRRLAAVILNYRTPDDTLLAVHSLLASRPALDEILVVDNDAVGGIRETLAAFDDRVTCLPTGANLGFSGGMNAGIRAVLGRGADRVLLVNSDVIVPPDCVARLERALEAVPDAGIVGPVVVSRSDPSRIASLGMLYAPVTGRMRHIGCGEPVTTVDANGSAPRDVDAIAGCLMLVTRDVFERAGLFDEDYFFAFEDLDFCLRARRAGFRTVVADGARVHHEGGRSLGAESSRRFYFAARNHLLAGRRPDGDGGRLPAAVRTVSIVGLNVAHALTAAGGTPVARLAAVVRGTRDYFAGRFGDRSG